MIKVELYKSFQNSSDFEKIIKKSMKEFGVTIPISYSDFVKTYIPKAIKNSTIVILFKNDLPIGYFVMVIENRTVIFSYSFILPEERGNKYSYILREYALNHFKDKFDKLNCFILVKNEASWKSLDRLLLKFKSKYKVEKKMFLGQNHLFYEIEKFS